MEASSWRHTWCALHLSFSHYLSKLFSFGLHVVYCRERLVFVPDQTTLIMLSYHPIIKLLFTQPVLNVLGFRDMREYSSC